MILRMIAPSAAILSGYDMNKTEITLEEIFNQEIVRESLREINPEVDDALVEKIWTLCEGNPWNAVPLYKILKTVGKV